MAVFRLSKHQAEGDPMLRIFQLSMLLALVLATTAKADDQPRHNFLVLGVIASDEPGRGVVLLKTKDKDQALAAKVGQEIQDGVTIIRATRRFVTFRIDRRTEEVEVGGTVDVLNVGPVASLETGGLERVGNKVTMTAGFRDEILKNQMTKVMMQAASVPYYEGNKLIGFRLWEIEPGSVYDRAGLANGDIVTQLNEQPLSDVGRAIKVMQSLRNEARIEISFIRKQKPMTIEVNVQ
jgi:type II secretion system protein C